MIETLTLQITIEVEGNADQAKEELRKSVLKCNGLCSAGNGESFSYKVIKSELIS